MERELFRSLSTGVTNSVLVLKFVLGFRFHSINETELSSNEFSNTLVVGAFDFLPAIKITSMKCVPFLL